MTMPDKLLIAALPIADVLNPTEAASILTRAFRAHDRTLRTDQIVQLPLVSGGEGTIDFLVTNALGSFLEVEATDAAGKQTIVPLGFAGEESNLAVIEMQRVAGVATLGQPGTTFGVGELIQDSLDESAFSVLLGLEEPLARDAGFGLGAALGVKFFDRTNTEIDFGSGAVDLTAIDRIDPSGRSFQLLSSRFFVARSSMPSSTSLGESDPVFVQELTRLAYIIKRDCGVDVDLKSVQSASGIELGLAAFLTATIGPGAELVLEASGIAKNGYSEFAACVVLAKDAAQVAASGASSFLEGVSAAVPSVMILFQAAVSEAERAEIGKRYPGVIVQSLQDVAVFQAPLSPSAGASEVRRDILMRIEKGVPSINERIHAAPTKGGRVRKQVV